MENQLPYSDLASKVLSAFSEQSQQTSSPAYSDAAQKVLDWSSGKSELPQDITNAKQQLGNTDKNGLCEQWQEQITGSPNMGTTAYNAWNNYIKNGQAYEGLQGAKPGDKVYFSGDGGLGHTGVISSIDPQGNANFISATDNGVKEMPINDWLSQTGEKLLGFVSSSK